MKKYIFLGLIYSLNIILFLFAKSAGAAVMIDKIYELRPGRSPAIECLKKSGNLKRCKLVVSIKPGAVARY